MLSVTLIIAIIIFEPISIHIRKDDGFTLTFNFAIFALTLTKNKDKRDPSAKPHGKRRKGKKRIALCLARPLRFLVSKSKISLRSFTYKTAKVAPSTEALARARATCLYSAAVALLTETAASLTASDNLPTLVFEDGRDTPHLTFDITVDLILVYIPAALALLFYEILKRDSRRGREVRR